MFKVNKKDTRTTLMASFCCLCCLWCLWCLCSVFIVNFEHVIGGWDEFLKFSRRHRGVFSEPCQTPKIERFAKIVNGFSPLTIFAKGSI